MKSYLFNFRGDVWFDFPLPAIGADSRTAWGGQAEWTPRHRLRGNNIYGGYMGSYFSKNLERPIFQNIAFYISFIMAYLRCDNGGPSAMDVCLRSYLETEVNRKSIWNNETRTLGSLLRVIFAARMPDPTEDSARFKAPMHWFSNRVRFHKITYILHG